MGSPVQGCQEDLPNWFSERPGLGCPVTSRWLPHGQEWACFVESQATPKPHDQGHLSTLPRAGGSTPGLPVHTHLGFALEVEGQHVLPGPRLALADHEESMAPGPTCQHQLSGLDP